jgi:hypothetical protein
MHAWRPSDLSDTSAALVSMFLGVAPAFKGWTTTNSGTPVGIGRATTSGISVRRMNPFCNTADANASPPTVSLGGVGDNQDLDPVRTTCSTSSGQREDVCGPFKGGVSNFQGDLGVVLPISLPRVGWPTDAELYPTTPCSGSCVPIAPMKSSLLGAGFKCPGGNAPSGGACFLPYAGNHDPRCASSNTVKCLDTVGKPDSRAYNIPVIVPSTSVPVIYRSTTAYQYALDVAQLSQGIKSYTPLAAYFRIHAIHPGYANVQDPAVGTTGICQMRDATQQIGCLVDAEPCSLGFGERRGAAYFPTLAPAPFKALALGGHVPFAPSGDPDATLKALFSGSSAMTPLYPLAHRVYINSTYGIPMLGGEAALFNCFSDPTLMAAANAYVGIASIPATPTHPTGGPKCLDYPEEQPQYVGWPARIGEGNEAFGGCINPVLPAVNACP